MNKRIAKKVVSVVLALALLASVCVSAFAANPGDALAGITWLTDANKGGAPDWALNATEAEQQATIAAIQAEYNYQYDEFGYDVGTVQLNSDNTILSPWPGNHVGVQFVGGDNTGYPFGTGDGRKMAFIRAYFPGMAFTLKGAAGAFWDKIPIGNEIAYTNGDSYIVQAVTDGFIVTNNTSGGTQHLGFMVGADAPDEVKAKMQYAYAAASAGITFGERVTLGYTDVKAVKEGDVYYQQIKSDAGESYIVAANDADEAYIVTGDVLTAWATTWTTESKFGVTGAPIGNAVTDENGVVTQEFEYATITVTPAAEEGAEPTVEIDYDIVQGDNVAVPMLDAGITHVTTPKAAISYGANADCVKDGGHGLAGANAALAAKGSEVVLSGANFDMMLEPSMGGTGSGDNGTQDGYADTDKSYHTMQVAIPEGATSFSTIIAMCDQSRNQTPAIQVPDDTFLYSMKAIDAEGNQHGDVVYSNGVNETFVINSTKPENYAIEMAIDEIPDGAVAIEIYIETGHYARWDHVAFFNSDFVVPVTDEDVAAAKAFTKAVKNIEDSADVKAARAAYDAMGATAKAISTVYADFAATEIAVRAEVTNVRFEAEAAVPFDDVALENNTEKDGMDTGVNRYDKGDGVYVYGMEGFGPDDSVRFTVYSTKDITDAYMGIDSTYWAGDSRGADVAVNGVNYLKDTSFSATGQWLSQVGVNGFNTTYLLIDLKAGKNEIVLSTPDREYVPGGMPHIDCIKIENVDGAISNIDVATAVGSLDKTTATWSASIAKDDAGTIAVNKNIADDYSEILRINNDISETVDYGVIYGVDEAAVAAATDDVMDGEKYLAKKVAFGTDENGNIKRTFGVTMENVAEGIEPVVKFYVVYKDNAGATHTVYSDVVGVAAAATPDGE